MVQQHAVRLADVALILKRTYLDKGHKDALEVPASLGDQVLLQIPPIHLLVGLLEISNLCLHSNISVTINTRQKHCKTMRSDFTPGTRQEVCQQANVTWALLRDAKISEMSRVVTKARHEQVDPD